MSCQSLLKSVVVADKNLKLKNGVKQYYYTKLPCSLIQPRITSQQISQNDNHKLLVPLHAVVSVFISSDSYSGVHR